MDKREACHRLAEINEEIYDLEESLSNIESKLLWVDDSEKERYLEKKEAVMATLERSKEEHDDFISEYSDVLYVEE